MSDSTPRFLAADMKIIAGDQQIPTQGWISIYGISRLRFPLGLPSGLKEPSASLKVEFGGHTAPISLLQHHGPGGLSYGARFLSLDLEMKSYLVGRLEQDAVRPFWNRRHKRLRVSSLSNVLHPRQCQFTWLGKEVKLEVLDFTAEGLRLLWPGTPANLRVGHLLNFTVILSSGEELPGMEGEIRNFSRINLASETPFTEIGLQINDLSRLRRGPFCEIYESIIRTL